MERAKVRAGQHDKRQRQCNLGPGDHRCQQQERTEKRKKEGARAAHPVLLEPVMNVEVVSPEAYMGDVLGDLSSRRGKIGGMTQRGEAQVISASVPLSEMFGYSTKLRSMSQGRAVYSMEFAHYEEVPKSKADEIIAKVAK